MSPSRCLYLLLCTLFLFFPISKKAFAEDNKLKELKNEVQELKQTVQELKTIVEDQNKRIGELEEKQAPVKKEKPPIPTVAEKKTEPKTEEMVETTPAETAATTPTPSQTYRQFGFWKVPVKPTGPSRFIPDISVIGVFAGAYFSQEPGHHDDEADHELKFQNHEGHDHGDTGHDPSRTGFNMQEIEIAFQSVIDPYVRADVFLAFHEDGVHVEEAYITTLSLPRGFQLKGGKYLLPFGRQNQKHLEQWAFVNDNLVNQRLLSPDQFNELGIEASYLFPTPFFLQLQADFTQGSTPGDFDGERKQDFAYTGRLSGSTDLTQNLTLLAGTSAAFGFNDTGPGNLTSLYGGDLLLKWKPSVYKGVEWQTEYIWRRREVPGGTQSEGGLYTHLLGNWSKRWGAGLRFDYMGIPRDTDRAYRLSPMVVFRPTEYFQVKAQYDYLNQAGHNPLHAAYLQWIFSMGPHGAHEF